MSHLLTLSLAVLVLCLSAHAREDKAEMVSIRVKASTKAERNRISSLGLAIDAVFSDSVGILGTREEAKKLKAAGFKLEVAELPRQRATGRGFPSADAAYHDYAELTSQLNQLQAMNPGLVQKYSIGKTLEGREQWGVRISSEPTPDTLPTAVFMGCHHAREHLSVEMPLKLAQYLVASYSTDPVIKKLLDTREVWIVPMVNPDGAEWDIATGRYKMWRKNRRKNGDGTSGVDLNRNYGGRGFGGPGSSGTMSSDIYRGPSAFSEPETANVRDFVKARRKATVLLTFHTYSELVLWPWGHSDDTISNAQDRRVFEKMGTTMASWNHYTPQQSSELYLASGDTADWAYDELKLFAFTFELSPHSMTLDGFYPGPQAIKPVFDANLKPALYLIENAEDPYKVLSTRSDK
jgi:carboxypeptidase T